MWTYNGYMQFWKLMQVEQHCEKVILETIFQHIFMLFSPAHALFMHLAIFFFHVYSWVFISCFEIY